MKWVNESQNFPNIDFEGNCGRGWFVEIMCLNQLLVPKKFTGFPCCKKKRREGPYFRTLGKFPSVLFRSSPWLIDVNHECYQNFWCECGIRLSFKIFWKNSRNNWKIYVMKHWKKFIRFRKASKSLRKNVNRYKPLKDFHVSIWKLLSFLNLLDHM